MRYINLVLLVFVLQMSIIETADARRRGTSEAQDLHFVTETSIPNQSGGTLSLCHLSNTHSVLFINIWRSIQSYALSQDKCEGDSFLGLTEEQFKQAQAANLIPANITAEPKMTIGIIAGGFWGLGALGLLILVGILGTIKSSRNKKERHEAMGNMSPFHKNILDVMCHAAMSDGDIDASEISVIQKAGMDLTGKTFTKDEVNHFISTCDKNVTPNQFKTFGKNMNDNEKLLLIRGALMVVAADNDLSKKEQKFIGGLANGLGVPVQTVQAMLGGGN